MTMSHPDTGCSLAYLNRPMSDDKRAGITQSIRAKLGFNDDNLWKRFSARRLELIDNLDLSSRKASDQENKILQVADILRLEFNYDPQYIVDFQRLVRAAVQSARRNRKRCSKRNRCQTQDTESAKPELGKKPRTGEENMFLSEISNLNADALGSVYDMSYSRSRTISDLDRSRAAIGSIIRPTTSDRKLSSPALQLPPLLDMALSAKNAENEKLLLDVKRSLLWLMKKSKLCLSLASLQKNESFKQIGQVSIAAVNALMLETSFSDLTYTSIDYLRDRVAGLPFQALFYRSLDPECTLSNSLGNEAAVTTLQTLVGCCVKDFGFDSVLYLIGEAFYLLILQEFPLILCSSVHFRRTTESPIVTGTNAQESVSEKPVLLSNLAAVASELQRQAATATLSSNIPSSIPTGPLEFGLKGPKKNGYTIPEDRSLHFPRTSLDVQKKKVRLRFLSSLLEFQFPITNSAPPRFLEIVDNAKQAFKLNDNQIYGLRNPKTGVAITTDLDLEHIFAHEDEIELEVFTQQFSKVSLSEITSVVTLSHSLPGKASEERPTIVLPLPVRQNRPHVMSSAFDRESTKLPGITRVPLLPKFQPLL